MTTQELLRSYYLIKNLMFYGDKKEARKIVACYHNGNADVADLEDLRLILAKYNYIFEFYEARDKFYRAWNKFENSLK